MIAEFGGEEARLVAVTRAVRSAEDFLKGNHIGVELA
jgi:hypothetical protein